MSSAACCAIFCVPLDAVVLDDDVDGMDICCDFTGRLLLAVCESSICDRRNHSGECSLTTCNNDCPRMLMDFVCSLNCVVTGDMVFCAAVAGSGAIARGEPVR